MFSWLHNLKHRHLLDFSEHVPLRFLVCQYIMGHGNDVAEEDLKQWLTNDMNFDSDTVYTTLYRMKGRELGHNGQKMLVEKNGRLSLINSMPQFVLMKASFWESWKTLAIPIGLLPILLHFFFPNLRSLQLFFILAFFILMVIWVIDDYVLKRIRFR